MNDKPNIVLIMTDQHRADVSAREGLALDTTPFLDGLARAGPARWPQAPRVRRSWRVFANA